MTRRLQTAIIACAMSATALCAGVLIAAPFSSPTTSAATATVTAIAMPYFSFARGAGGRN